PIWASTWRRASAASGLTGASSVNATWSVIPLRRRLGMGRQGEVEDAVAFPEDQAEVEAGRDEADFVADPVRDERGPGVVEDDTLLAVEPARRAVDLGDD